MAVRRSTAASLSSTLGIAAATLVVAGAILAWPTLSHCSAEPGSFGACLREALAERGLAPREDEPRLPVVPAGWLDARANEIAPPQLPSIALSDQGGGMVAVNAPETESEPQQVALAPAAPLVPVISATVPEPRPATPLEPARGIDVTGAVAARGPDAKVALVGPVGAITVTAPVAAELPVPEPMRLIANPAGTLAVETPANDASSQPPLPVTALPAPLGAPAVPVKAEPPPVELTAEIAPVPVTPPTPEPVPEEPAPVIAFDPAYPNVLVLPGPASGDDSSFRTWTFD